MQREALFPAPTPAGRSRAPLVLVVDDVEGNRQLVCRRLAPCGYDLHAVESGQQALDFMRVRKPDLVLLDSMMPAMNGMEMLRILRQDWKMATVPVIMLTARAEAEAVVEALEGGADDYVTKPVDFDVLKARIETQLTKMRSSDQLRQANATLDERATMRVLAFDELRDELEREIAARRRAEKALEEMMRTGAASAGGVEDRGPALARALEMVDAIARSAAQGRAVNPALVAALRAAVEGL
jgi:DNA-binding response OmpR family regulator